MMCARVEEVVSVPGPRFSLASESAVLGGRPARVNVCIKLGLAGFSSRIALVQAFSAHYRIRLAEWSSLIAVSFMYSVTYATETLNMSAMWELVPSSPLEKGAHRTQHIEQCRKASQLVRSSVIGI